MEAHSEIVQVKLENGMLIRVEATPLGSREEDVAFSIRPFKEVTDAIEGIAQSIVSSLEKIRPQKASVEFGLEVGAESGQLTALIVKGSGKANLKVTLEWSQSESRQNVSQSGQGT